MKKPDTKHLDSVLNPVLSENGVTRNQWKDRMIGNIAKLLKKTPNRYKAYGPWWWPLKQELIASGYADFGESVDAEWVDRLAYGDPVYDVLAAFLYEDDKFDNGAMYDPVHQIENEDGELTEYVLIDIEMDSGAGE